MGTQIHCRSEVSLVVHHRSSAIIVQSVYFRESELRANRKSVVGVIVVALMGGPVLPGSLAQADPSCTFQPSPLRVAIDPAFFELREEFDPEDPFFQSFFYPRQQGHEVTYPRTGPNAGLEFVTPSLTIGATIYEGLRIPFPNPAVVPDDGSQIFLSLPNWLFTLEVAQRFFPDLDEPENAIWNPLSYPISWAFELSFSTGANTCRFEAVFQVIDGRGFDFDASRLLERIPDGGESLPSTV